MCRERRDWKSLPHRMTLGMRRQTTESGAITSESIICNAYYFPGETADPERIESALRRAVRAHPALHSTYRTAGEHGAQYAELPLPPALLEREDLGASPWDRLRARAREVASRESGRVLDLRSDPPLRAVLLHGAAGFALVIRIDHSVCDGISYARFLRDVGEAYGAADEEPTVAGRPTLAEVAAAERPVLEGESGKRLRAAWRERLPSGVPEVMLGDTTSWREGTAEGAYRVCHIDGERYREHVAEAKRLRVTSFVLATAKILHALRPSVVNDELAFFCPFPGRFVPEAGTVMGNFVNLLPVVVDAGRDADLATTVRAVRDGVVWTMQHQGLPFDAVLEQVRDVDPTGETMPKNRRAIFIAGYPEDELDLGGARAQAELPVMTTALFDLSVWISDTRDAVRCMAVYRPRYVSPEQVDAWFAAVGEPLEAAALPAR